MNKKIKVFCPWSDSHEDKLLFDQLRLYLSPLEQQEIIDIRSNDDISAGAVQVDEENRYLSAAQIILLPISSDFIASNRCDAIMRQAMKRRREEAIPVVPILLRPVDLQNTPVADLRPLPKNAHPITEWSNRDSAFLNVAQEIRHMVENLSKPSPPPHERNKPVNMDNVSHIPQTLTYSPLDRGVKPKKESNTIRNRAGIPTWLSILIIIGLVGIGGIYIPQIIHSADNNSRSNTPSPLQSTASTPSSTSGTTSSNSLGNTPSPLQSTASTPSSTSGITKISENQKLLCPACSDPAPSIVLDSITIETNNIKTTLYFTITNPRTDSCVFGYPSIQLYDPDGNEHYARLGGGGGTISIAPNNSIKDSAAFNNFIPIKGTQYTLKVAFGRYYASCASSNSQDNIYQNTTLIF